SSHSKIRYLIEQAMAALKNRYLLRKLRCSTNRIPAIV
ncbi:IS5/IS1182 family transposase, partial [Streptomyces sp. NPDC056921]